ncbi:ERG4/ERG24 ergosterol biosynthesis protein [Flagelloscypha sp. PMI_526]|nr:ERG4/ERG24 ergosterol biosynthesis protein [Flagelloscypha sp. PMI_526]
MADKSEILNPRTKRYEFLGPPGAFLITIGVPLVTYGLYFGCSEETGGCPPTGVLDGSILPKIQDTLTSADFYKSLWDTEATLMYFAWYMFCVVCWRILPGDVVEGTTLRTGEKKKYKMNGLQTLLVTMGFVLGRIVNKGPESFTFLYEKWVPFITATVLMSVTQALLCYAASFRSGALLALGGNSGNFIYDFFIGRELNPQLPHWMTLSSPDLPLDIKTFNELRPGMILWFLLDISMACEQAVRSGKGINGVTDSLWLVLLFHGIYIVDSVYNEIGILTMMDITTDGFGFMLSVGDLTWVPFAYSLQARYLVFKPQVLGPFLSVVIVLANLTGFYIFRTANGEKNDFRNGKNPKNLQYMTTETGTKLLTSGWWGRSRHPNYFGDLLMGLAWSLPTKFETPLTYFYVIYFAVLLAHRQNRDDEACSKKYGKDWEKYKKLVPWKIIPYVY